MLPFPPSLEPSEMTMSFRYPADFDPDLMDTNSSMYTETVEAIASEVHNLHPNDQNHIDSRNRKISIK